MNDASPAGQDKFRRYRARKKAAGLREVRMWVLDTRAPGFQERLTKQIAAINASKEDREIAEDMQRLTDEVWTSNP